MKNLCIYGCGGLGREIADLARRIGQWGRIAFVDDNITGREVDRIKVYTFEEMKTQLTGNGLEVIVAVGEPVVRKAIYERLANNKLNYAKVIDPGFILSTSSSIAGGTVVHTGAIATCNVHIQEGCLINKQAVIGHDVTIGKYSVISPSVSIGGNVNIGSGCYLGSGAIIRNGIDIGTDSIIGMGAVVLSDVKPNSVMVGNPARRIRDNLNKKVFR